MFSCPLLKHQRSKLGEFVEAAGDGNPTPSGGASFVVVHAVEVGSPFGAGFGRDVGQGLQHAVGEEDFGLPALDGGSRLFGAGGRGGSASFA